MRAVAGRRPTVSAVFPLLERIPRSGPRHGRALLPSGQAATMAGLGEPARKRALGKITRRTPTLSRTASALAVAALLGTTLSNVSSTAAAEPVKAPAASDSDRDGDLDRATSTQAATAARALEEPVEDLSARTESTRTFANPDGTFTREDFGAPVRVQRKGTWVDVDYSLVKQADGSYAPKAAPVDVSVGGAGTATAATVTFEDGEQLDVTWPGTLPKPTVSGGVATYKLSKATDLLVSVTGAGANVRIRLNERPATGDPVYALGLRGDGLDVEQTKDGLTFRNDDGEQVGKTANLTAWDARTDSAGDPAAKVQLDADLAERPAGTDTLKLATPDGFLNDPATKYPVTIDPDINAASEVRDTWVRGGQAAAYGEDYRLLVGKINGSSNTNPARSYLRFDTAPLNDDYIVSSQLGLFQYNAYSCTDRAMYVQPVAEDWTAAMTWDNRADVRTDTGHSVTVSDNKGASGCAAGWITANVTGMVKAWTGSLSSGNYRNYGIRLAAGDETLSGFNRYFCSFNPDSASSVCNQAARRPYLKTTYVSAAALDTLPAASTRVSNGTGTAADVDLLKTVGLYNSLPDNTVAPEVTAVDEDDVAETDNVEETETVPAPTGDEPACTPTAEVTCIEDTTTEPDPNEVVVPGDDEPEPTDPPAGAGSPVQGASTIKRCSDGHRARRYTVTLTKRSLLRQVQYRFNHRVHYCTRNGKVTKWRATLDWISDDDGSMDDMGTTFKVRSGLPVASAYSQRQHKLQRCIGVKDLSWCTYWYPWSKLTVDGKGGKKYTGRA